MERSVAISVRIPESVLGRIDAAAKRDGVTRTAVLLRPWGGDDEPEPVEPAPKGGPRSRTTVVASKRARVETRRIRGYDALTKEPIYD